MELTDYHRQVIPPRFIIMRNDDRFKQMMYMRNMSFTDGSMIDILISKNGNIKQFIFEHVIIKNRDSGLQKRFTDMFIYFPAYKNEESATIEDNPEYFDLQYVNELISQKSDILNRRLIILFSDKQQRDKWFDMLSKSEIEY